MTFAKPLLFWTTILALAISGFCLTNPTATIGHTVHRYLLVLDITESMNVEDVSVDGVTTSRLQKSKLAIQRVIQKLHCDSQIALAIFTEHRTFLLITPVSICNNFTDLNDILEHIDWNMAWRSQSEIAKGISSAIHINDSLATNTKIVFFSDGHESPPIHPDLRFRIKNGNDQQWGLLVGVGGTKLRPIPKLDENARKSGYWHANEVAQYDSFTAAIMAGKSLTGVAPNPSLTGHEHLSSIKQQYLIELANEAGFEYLRLDDHDALANKLAATKLGEVVDSEQDIRPHLLVLCLTIFLIGFLAQFKTLLAFRRASI